jgi:sugar phosphate isomerase/epimerase
MAASLPIAAQLYSLRNLQIPFDELLSEVAAIGYTGVETVGDHGLSADEMRDLLQKHGLQICSAHVALAKLEADFDAVIEFHTAVGNPIIVIPWIPEAARAPEAAGWFQLGRQLGELGRRVRDAGLQLMYHNHAFEMAKLEGKLAIDWLLDGAEAENLGFEIDLAWVQRGGQNGVELLERYRGRCPRVHCKDLAPEGQNQDEMGFADVGYGVLDWASLLPAAKAAGAEWYIVEHDLPKAPLESIRRSFDFLKDKIA